MTQENKELLMKGPSCRIPYGVIVKSEVKPYLFPLSNMTSEQYNEFFNYYHNIEIEEIKASGDYLKAEYLSDGAKYEWLNGNNFD